MYNRSYNSVSVQDREDFKKVYEATSTSEELFAYQVFRQTKDYYESINEKREEVLTMILDEIQSIIDNDNDPKYLFLSSLIKQLSNLENNFGD